MKVPHKIQTVIQPTHNTCTSACIAMMTGLPVDQVIEEFHKAYMRHHITPSDYLRSKGLYVDALKVEEKAPFFDRVYLAAAPSLNILGGTHSIVLDLRDEFTVYDPNYRKEGKKYYTYNQDDDHENAFMIKGYFLECVYKEPENEDD